MRNGIIYVFIDWIIDKLEYLNLVELFKWVAKKIYPTDKLLASRLGVDIFIVFKWATIITLWSNEIKGEWINLLIWYLITTNLFTYFYYHNWTKDLEKKNYYLSRIKRRFLNLMLAISFNIFSFAYLIAVPFSENFQWINQDSQNSDALLYSIANSLTVDYNPVQAITQIGHTLTLIVTITTFIFLTIILSNSIPQIKDN